MRNALFSNGGWLLRLVTVAAMAVVIGLSLFPRAVSHISTSATVNAPIMVVRSPVDGVVERYDLATGEAVSTGQDLVIFREARTDPTQQVELEARLFMAEAAAAAVDGRIAEVEDLRAKLLARQKIYAAWHIAILEQKVAEIAAQIASAAERLAAIKWELARREALRARGALSDGDLIDVAARRAEQVERIRELEARHEARRLKLQAAKDGILAGTDGTNTPYTLQRKDEIDLELARLRDELADHRAEQVAIREQLAIARERYRRENRVALTSPVSGVVWRSAALTGRPVLPGDEVVEIVDCDARFLEAYLPESLMGSISVGDLAEIRLTGASRVFEAPVVSILGHGARFDHAELAAQDDAVKTGKMRVLIALGEEDLAHDAGRFCDVGRTAQVSMPRRFSRFGNLGRRLGETVEAVSDWLRFAAVDTRQG